MKIADELWPGLYEKVINNLLGERLTAFSPNEIEREALDPGESYLVLSQYLTSLIARVLQSTDGIDRINQQVTLCNQIIELLATNIPEAIPEGSQVSSAHERLLAILPPHHVSMSRPDTPLSASCLLTGTRLDPSLVSQLRHELRSANEVDILCSFIKWSGIRILEDELRAFTERAGSRLRVITTSYMGATDVKAVEFLRGLPHTEIKLSYDTQRTRLHAKAYLFHRKTGFGAAYIGSANLSHAALTDGLEWNVKLSQYETAHLWEKVAATFETYWNDSEFTFYKAEDRTRLQAALAQERVGSNVTTAFLFEIRPYPYQQEVLDKLEAERQYHGRFRNLVVAATGTGKTVIAALDYKRFRQARMALGQPARLLFVAHRKEILEQSIQCFRGVLRDQNFGELLVGEYEAVDIQHLFTSIQSYNSRRLWTQTATDFYDYVVIDESHRTGAEAYYKSLLEHVQPQILLGLTATPERGDGRSILADFGGHISAEIRLATAINRKMLSPFQYFGITDEVNLGTLTWQRGGYLVRELEGKYLDNDSRADLIVCSVRDKLLDVQRACGLGFCVSVAHARYMADYFTRSGIPALALSSESSTDERGSARQRLVTREINFLFVVDLYNEGVDIPEVDTILFLRPTESLTVFLQQFGRGLRLCEGKECLTVLDFIGQAHRSYNFEMRFRALMDSPKKRIDREIEHGSMPLPVGCTLQLEKIAKQYVMDNIRRALDHTSAGLVQRIQTFQADTGTAPTLALFLDYYETEIDTLYQRGSWTRLLQRAGLLTGPDDPDADQLAKGLRRIAHFDSPIQLDRLRSMLAVEAPVSSYDERDRRLLTMLHVSLWGGASTVTLQERQDQLAQNPAYRAELQALLAYRHAKVSSISPLLSLPFLCPLELHAAYTRDEVLTGLGYWTLEQRPAMREGVIYLRELPSDVFFVTLNKTEKDYSPTTMYADYAINDRLFHWQSQSTTAETSATGQRYINHQKHGHTLLLFVREEKAQNNLAEPYIFLGPALYQKHQGDRPMSLELELSHPIPARFLPMMRRLAIA